MRTSRLIAAVGALALVGAANADIMTSFDSSEGFTAGVADGQNGYDAYVASTTQPVIETANPFSGDQHLRISDDPAIADGTSTGVFSPLDTPAAVLGSTLSIEVYIDDAVGADYNIIGQSPSQGFLTYQVNFNFQGNIRVVDDIGAGLAFIDTGVAYQQQSYANLTIDFDPVAGTIEYFYDGSSIYVGGLVAGTNVEGLVINSDNWQGTSGSSPAFADFDDLSLVQDIPEPGSLALLGLGGLAILRRRR